MVKTFNLEGPSELEKVEADLKHYIGIRESRDAELQENPGQLNDLELTIDSLATRYKFLSGQFDKRQVELIESLSASSDEAVKSARKFGWFGVSVSFLSVVAACIAAYYAYGDSVEDEKWFIAQKRMHKELISALEKLRLEVSNQSEAMALSDRLIIEQLRQIAAENPQVEQPEERAEAPAPTEATPEQ